MSISRLHRVAIVFHYLGNLAVENSNLTGFPENWACVCEFPENPLYQKPPTTSIVRQKGEKHMSLLNDVHQFHSHLAIVPSVTIDHPYISISL